MSRRKTYLPTVEALESRTHLTATLAAELNTGTLGIGPTRPEFGWVTRTTDRLFYMANDGVHGDEVWSSDGTPAGTRLAADLTPGSGGTDSPSSTAVGRLVFFDRLLPGFRHEFWRTDGTPDGTFRVAETGVWTADAAAVADTLYYSVPTADGGHAIHATTDGTPATTRAVLTTAARPARLTAAGDLLLYATGDTLWRYDGTRHTPLVTGTSLETIHAAPLGGYAVVRRSNSTTAEVLDTRTGARTLIPGATYPTVFTSLSGNRVGFGADSAPWVTDGTAAGTGRLRAPDGGLRVFNAAGFGELNGELYFAAYRDSGPVPSDELWKVPAGGTRSSAVRVAAIDPTKWYSGYIGSFREFGGLLYFNAHQFGLGTELWRTDGTTAGTRLAADINPFEAGGAGRLTVLAGRLAFVGTTARYGRELYAFDGATVEPVRDVNQTPAGATFTRPELTTAAYSTGAAVVGDRFYFAADGVAGGTGTELWVSDGTQAGTRQVTDILPGNAGSSPELLTAYGDGVIFRSGTRRELWRSDGTPGGTARVGTLEDVASLAVSGGRLYAGTPSGGLWVLDGPGSAGVREVAPGGRRLTGVAEPVDVDGALFFAADDGLTGGEVWRTDGTDAGTVPLTDANPAGTALRLGDAVAARGRYFFLKQNGSYLELWSAGARPGDAVMAGVLDWNSGGVYPLLSAAGGLVYFAHHPAGTLWRSDGTPSGTTAVPSHGAWNGYSVHWLTPVGDLLFFAASGRDGRGNELWRTDGTAGGTRLVKDIEERPYPTDQADPTHLVDAGGVLLFSARDAAHGRELWLSDGTEAGTRRVADLMPGPGGSDPLPLAVVGGTAYFGATSPSTGRELWRTEIPPAVRSVAVNAGTAQRSRVGGLTVTFAGRVAADPGAFALAGRAGAGAGVTVSAANPSGDGRTWVLAFAGPGVVGGSLPDGVYDLTVVAAKVHAGSAAGPAMAADHVVTFHRLFGDANGSRGVNNADYLLFRNAFGKPSADPASIAAFDFDGNGTVNNADYLQFRSRFGTALSY